MRRRRIASALLGLVLLAAGCGVAAYVWLQRYLDAPLPMASAVVIEIPTGSSMATVAALLHRHATLRHPRVLTLWARYTGIDTAVRAGEFELRPGLTPRTALNHLLVGPFFQYPVAFIEGTTFAEALNTLWNSPRVLPTLQGLGEAELLAALNSPRESLEGLLFPDTYFYTAGTTDLSILRRASARLDQVLADEWGQRQQDLPYTSPYEALIMASIIEKESGMVSERSEIAGVFVRRLRLGMRLQSDPTVIYGMGNVYDGNIRREDLERVTPYNTYRINGLPPSPIALSGRDAIRASLNPASGTALYFVATGDGGHVFSDTLEAHNAAVRQYQLGQQP
jgi:UPF0755 protein